MKTLCILLRSEESCGEGLLRRCCVECLLHQEKEEGAVVRVIYQE